MGARKCVGAQLSSPCGRELRDCFEGVLAMDRGDKLKAFAMEGNFAPDFCASYPIDFIL